MHEQTSHESTVLFLSLGKGSHIVLPQIFYKIRPSYVYLVHTRVIDDSYNLSNAPQYLKEEVPKIKYALSEIESMKSKELKGAEIKQILVPATDPTTVRDTLLPYLYEHPTSTYYFHLSAGTSELILSMLTLALWKSAKIWLTPKNEYNMEIDIPKMHISNLSEAQRELIRYLGKKQDASHGMEVERNSLAKGCGYMNKNTTRFSGNVAAAFYKDMNPLLDEYTMNYRLCFGLGLVKRNIESSREHYRLTESGLHAWRLLSLEGSEGGGEPPAPKQEEEPKTKRRANTKR